jgi:hypothetical protein
MHSRILLISFLMMAMSLSACLPIETESVVGEEDAELSPPSSRTGIAYIDIVLDAVENDNPEQLRALLRFINIPCTNAEGLGGPPKCRDSESEGAFVEVFPFLGSEGGYLHKENLDLWTGIDVTQLYAVYQNSDNVYSDENFPAGEYAILFLSEDDFPGTILQITDGLIVRIDTVFDTSPEGLATILKRDALELILSFPK